MKKPTRREAVALVAGCLEDELLSLFPGHREALVGVMRRYKRLFTAPFPHEEEEPPPGWVERGVDKPAK